jgi:hypothetical protein
MTQPSRMRRVARLGVVWLAALLWVAGWSVHAGMTLAQAAGQAQICSTRGENGPSLPKGAPHDCASCAQALAAAAPSSGGIDGAFLHPAGDAPAQAPRVAFIERTRRDAAHAPRAPPAA